AALNPDIFTLSLHDALPICQVGLSINAKIWPTIPVDQIFVNFITYQDDLMTPGSSPRCAISRRRTREIPNFCRVPRGRPSMESRDRKSTRLNSSHVSISYAV